VPEHRANASNALSAVIAAFAERTGEIPATDYAQQSQGMSAQQASSQQLPYASEYQNLYPGAAQSWSGNRNI